MMVWTRRKKNEREKKSKSIETEVVFDWRRRRGEEKTYHRSTGVIDRRACSFIARSSQRLSSERAIGAFRNTVYEVCHGRNQLQLTAHAHDVRNDHADRVLHKGARIQQAHVFWETGVAVRNVVQQDARLEV